eukprot:TRINITY_DN11508_c0_g1_i1.p1 TRINITY_DN11508_c0_g1~~TRINITY_DN11508_c0_g1_i1.p1  ORF type:complete len:649 (+),score=87.30 TRINITY_DN11508_c0_g1_i1:79-2025(+)
MADNVMPSPVVITIVVIVLLRFAMRCCKSSFVGNFSIAVIMKDMWGRPSESLFENCVREQMLKMRGRRYNIFCTICERTVAARAVFLLAKVMWVSTFQSLEPLEVDNVALARVAVILAFFQIMPTVTETCGDRVYFILSWAACFLQVFFILMTFDQRILIMHRPQVVLVRTFVAVLLGGVRPAIGHQILVSAAQWYVFSCKGLERPLDTNGFVPSPHMFLQQEFTMAACTIAMTYVFEKTLDTEARATLSQKEASAGKDTAESLLSVMCDAVAHADADIVLSKPAPKLAALLSMPADKLEGSSLHDLMSSDDATRFQTLCQAARTDRLAKALNARFLDGHSNTVNMQLFIASYQRFDDQPGYVFGFQDADRCNRETTWGPLPCIDEASSMFEHVALDEHAYHPVENESRCETESQSIQENCPSEVETCITAGVSAQLERNAKQAKSADEVADVAGTSHDPIEEAALTCEEVTHVRDEQVVAELMPQTTSQPCIDFASLEGSAAVLETEPDTLECRGEACPRDNAFGQCDLSAPFWYLPSEEEMECLDRERLCFRGAVDTSNDEFWCDDDDGELSANETQDVWDFRPPATTSDVDPRDEEEKGIVQTKGADSPVGDFRNAPLWELSPEMIDELDRQRERIDDETDEWPI